MVVVVLRGNNGSKNTDGNNKNVPQLEGFTQNLQLQSPENNNYSPGGISTLNCASTPTERFPPG